MLFLPGFRGFSSQLVWVEVDPRWKLKMLNFSRLTFSEGKQKCWDRVIQPSAASLINWPLISTLFVMLHWWCGDVLIFWSVVKEELIDDDAHLPCFNGRVISWVGGNILSFANNCYCVELEIIFLKFDFIWLLFEARRYFESLITMLCKNSLILINCLFIAITYSIMAFTGFLFSYSSICHVFSFDTVNISHPDLLWRFFLLICCFIFFVFIACYSWEQ